MHKLTKGLITTTALTSTLLISGCGLLGGGERMQEIDPPQNVTYLEEGQETGGQTVAQEKSGNDVNSVDQEGMELVMREIFLIDKNGFVVPHLVAMPQEQGVAKQALEYLVQNGPVTDQLSDGFRAVLPPDTVVKGVNLLEDGTIVADFSQEFINYNPDDEVRILQSITWTLTQFENVKQVKIRINGHDQSVMPVNGTPIGDGVNRANGINNDSSEIVDITNSRPVTVYYLAENSNFSYYVPVTRRVSNLEKDNIIAVINELIKGPSYSSGLLSEFSPEASLLEAPRYENGKITLNFNEYILGNYEGNIVSKHVIDSLVLSLTEQPGVESVSILVNGNSNIISEEGAPLSEPVTRPENVNTGSF